MASIDKDFKVKNGLIVGDSTNLVNYSSSSPSNPFIGQLWISASSLYAWSSASTWVLVGDGRGGGSASGTPLNIPNTLVSRSASGIFSIGGIDLDLSGTVPLGVGRFQWNSSFGTPEIGLIGGNITAHIGQHVHAYVTNAEGSPLVKGDVVYLFGASGDRASVKKAINTSDSTSAKSLGVVAEAITTGGQGFVTIFGVVDKLNLSAYSPGDTLWLSASAGKFTSVKPSAPKHTVFIGVVERANAGNGQLFVNVQNGYELGELHDVLINSVTNNDIISYNASSSVWFNQNLATAITEVDGAGSGIDADLLDGQHASYFLNTSSATQERTGTTTFHGTVNINNLVITGSATTITSTNLALTDSLIQLAHEQYTTDAVDIGIVGSYGDGTTSSANHYHTSFARDASQNKWKLLSKGPAAVNNTINYSDPSVEFGVLQIAALEVSSSVTVTNFNADMLDGQHGLYYQNAAGASATYLKQSDAASAYIRVTSSAAIVSGYIPVSASQAYLTRTTASTLYMSIGSTANHANTASSINSSLITGTTLPSSIVNSSLTSLGTLSGNLILSQATEFSPQLVIRNTNALDNSGYLIFSKSPGASAALIGMDLGTIIFQGPDINGVVKNSSYITVESVANSSASGIPSNMSFYTGDSVGSPTPVLNLTSSKRVGIGTFSPVTELHVIGSAIISGNASAQTFTGALLGNANTASSINWSRVTDIPDPVIGVSLTGNTTGAASATLTDLANGQISIVTNTSFSTSASSINWDGVTNKPDPIIGINLTGIVTGAASATLTDLQNGQISITTAMNIITNAQSGTSYSLVLSDAGDLVELNNASPITLVIPLNSTQAFPTGTKIDILQTGAGQVTASYVSGVTLNSSGGATKLVGQWSAATLIKRGTDTWVAIGDLTV